MLSQTAEYALRAVLYLAAHEGSSPVRAVELARALDAPENYLHKTLHALVKHGILTSTRGPAGGFELAIPAASLSLEAVIQPFDRVQGRCLLGQPRCGDHEPCALHEHWKGLSTQVVAFFRTTMVADVAEAGMTIVPQLTRPVQVPVPRPA